MLLGLLPGFAWLIFYLGEDSHPEPNRLIVLTFVAGIAFGFFTIVIEQGFNAVMAAANVAELSIASLLGLALIEEAMKFAAAHFAVGKSPVLQDPVDAMIYMIVAALGFATLENIGAITSIASANTAAGQGALLISIFETVSLRFVGATLLHSLTSAIVGYHWALGMVRRKVPHYIATGLIIATILHATFNYLILNYADVGYSILFLLVIGFFVLNDFERLKMPIPAA
jgi:RsiW-degrading membrane proteinase PrsW (M82 family)